MLPKYKWKEERRRLREASKRIIPELPKSWKQMSVEEQCSYLNHVLYEIANVEGEHDLHVTIRCRHNSQSNILNPQYEAEAFVQATDEPCRQKDEISYVLCHAICRNPKLKLDDVPEPLREWGIERVGEADALELFKCYGLGDRGATISEALERLFYRLILMLKGYELLYLEDDFNRYCDSTWVDKNWDDDEAWNKVEDDWDNDDWDNDDYEDELLDDECL